MKTRIAFLVLALCLLSACQRSPRLIILHTNDTHSHFEPLRGGEQAGKCGVIERAAFIDSIRTVYGEDKVLLLDAGDFSQGTSYFSELNGQLEPRIINDMRYDCVTLGNHEFDNDIDVYILQYVLRNNISLSFFHGLVFQTAYHKLHNLQLLYL